MSIISEYDLPAVSTRTRLQIQKRLDERSKRAMTQREETPELLPTKEDVKVLNINDDRPEVIANKHRKALAIQVRLQNMSNNQIVDELDWKPSVIKSETTQQMIDEYRAEQNAPVKIARPDGREEFFKYDPTSIDLTPITPSLDPVLSEAEIRDSKTEIVQRLGAIRQIKYFLSNIASAERKAIDATYDREKAKYKANPVIDYAALRAEVGKARKKDQPAIAAEFGEVLKEKDSRDERKKILLKLIAEAEATGGAYGMPDPIIKYEADKEDLRQRITAATEDEKTLIAEIDGIKAAIKDNERKIYQNKINTVEAEKQTRARNIEAADELKVRNTGKVIPDQQPGESDDAYRQRLIDLGDEVFDDDEVERNAKSLQIVRAKYNLKEFISDASKIENIIKKLSSDELTVFNTRFPAYKKKYLETYGFNNRNMSVDNIVDFIQSDLTEPPETAPPPAPTRTANRPYAFSSFNKTQLLYIAETNGIPRRATNQEMYDELLRLNLIPKTRDPFSLPTFPDIPAGVPVVYPAAPIGTPIKASPSFPAIALGPTVGRGIGVHLRKLPSVVQFGKIHIKPSNLYYENILSIRTSTGQALRAYKDEKISNHLASLIIKLLEGGTVSKNDLRSLSEKEVMIYDNLVRRSQLHKELDNSWDETAMKMKTRFQILEGQIGAGNDNPLIKEELHELLFKMGNSKIITPHEASRYWNEMNK